VLAADVPLGLHEQRTDVGAGTALQGRDQRAGHRAEHHVGRRRATGGRLACQRPPGPQGDQLPAGAVQRLDQLAFTLPVGRLVRGLVAGMRRVIADPERADGDGRFEPRTLLVHHLREDRAADRDPRGMRHQPVWRLRGAAGRARGEVLRGAGDGRTNAETALVSRTIMGTGR
jgi:hypothetical protein